MEKVMEHCFRAENTGSSGPTENQQGYFCKFSKKPNQTKHPCLYITLAIRLLQRIKIN